MHTNYPTESRAFQSKGLLFFSSIRFIYGRMYCSI